MSTWIRTGPRNPAKREVSAFLSLTAVSLAAPGATFGQLLRFVTTVGLNKKQVQFNVSHLKPVVSFQTNADELNSPFRQIAYRPELLDFGSH